LLISIIIPVYNEESSIKKILLKINKVKKINKEIILIDDGSSDKTRFIIKNECKFIAIYACKVCRI
jgi:glycosyltransferase involved in cell wall biosynthesis